MENLIIAIREMVYSKGMNIEQTIRYVLELRMKDIEELKAKHKRYYSNKHTTKENT